MSKIIKASYVEIDDTNIFNVDNSIDINTIGLYENNDETSKEEIRDLESEDYDINLEKLREEIKSEVIELAREQSDIIIKNARNEASKIIEEAKYEQEQINLKISEIYDENFQKGYEDGYSEGIAKAELESTSMKNEAKNILLNASRERQEMIDKFEPEIVQFIIDTTKNILTNSFEFNPEIIILLIRKGLFNIKELKNLKIYISNENYNTVVENKEKILKVDFDKNNIEIIKDNSLEKTDCIIETEIGNIKCGVDDQFSSIKEALHYILN